MTDRESTATPEEMWQESVENRLMQALAESQRLVVDVMRSNTTFDKKLDTMRTDTITRINMMARKMDTLEFQLRQLADENKMLRGALASDQLPPEEELLLDPWGVMG